METTRRIGWWLLLAWLIVGGVTLAHGQELYGSPRGGAYWNFDPRSSFFTITSRYAPGVCDFHMWANGACFGLNVQPTVVAPPGSGVIGVSMIGTYLGGAFETDTSGSHSSYVGVYSDSPTVHWKGATIDYIIAHVIENVRPNPTNVPWGNIALWAIGRNWIHGHPDIPSPALEVRAALPNQPALVLRASAWGQTVPLIRCENAAGQPIAC